MSDEHKPHDDHGHAGHDDHGPAAHDAHGHDDHAAHPVADAHGHGHDDHAAHPVADAHGHGHDDHAAPAAADHAHDDHGHEAHGHEAHGHDDHAPAAHGHDDHAAHPAADAHGHEDHAVHSAADAHGHEDHTVHPAAEAHGHDAHGHDDHAHGHDDHAAAHADDTAHDSHAAPVAVAAAAAAAAAPKPVWSDAGDAPFEDVDSTPVYARGKGGKKKSGGGSGSESFEFIKTIFFALLIAFVLRVVLFQPFTIPSASMEPNLSEGDYIVVSKWSYGYSKHSIPFSPPIFDGRISLPMVSHDPERGDVVVFKLPRDDKTDYIKRLIGLPGDRIQMINNVLNINGQPVRDVVVSGADVTNMYGMPIVRMRETLPEGKTITIQDFGPGNDLDDTPVFEVPAGHYFMMGDNRDNSIDSRVEQSQGVGLVPEENLIGKAEIILFSWSPGASLWYPVSWFSKIRPSRFFTVLD